MKHGVAIILAISIILTDLYGQGAGGALTPDRLILSLTSEPYSSMAVTWRTKDPSGSPRVQYAEATPWTQFTDHIKTSIALTEWTELDDDSRVYYYSAVLNGLRPEASYVYRVGDEGFWSEWCQFKTASDSATPFEFLFFGDPQNDIKEHMSRLFREALLKVPEARFWLFSGDITSEPEDYRWGELFYAAGFAFKTIPSIMVPGNHDNAYKKEGGKFVLNEKGGKVRSRLLPPTWRAQFTFPQNGISGFEEASYYLDYQGVRIIMLNSNDRLEEQSAWMDSILGAGKMKWNIVSFHHPLYSVGGGRNELGTRNAFLPVFDKHGVDLVLSGHDHVYARSHKLREGSPVPDGQPGGTVYVVSVSGPKMYDLNPRYENLMAKTGGQVQLFQSVRIEGDKLIYRSMTPTGDIYDQFELKK